MDQATKRANGWSETETSILMSEAHSALQAGMPIKSVFEKMAERTGRKPNSIRNYYYLKLREETGSGKTAFVPFSGEESDALLRRILSGSAQGRSVRSIALEMGSGDKKAMLRYQNKYRSLLRADPERVRRVMSELRSEGVAVRDPFAADNPASSAAFTETVREMSRAGIDPTGLFRELLTISRKLRDHTKEKAALLNASAIFAQFAALSPMERISSLESYMQDMKNALFYH